MNDALRPGLVWAWLVRLLKDHALSAAAIAIRAVIGGIFDLSVDWQFAQTCVQGQATIAQELLVDTSSVNWMHTRYNGGD